MAIEAGLLRDRVDIERQTPSDGDYGKQLGDWAAIAECVAARVRPLRALEVLRAQQPVMNTDHIVTMRYRANLTSDCRLKIRNTSPARYLYITGMINVDNRNVEWELTCSEVAPNG